jgi:uncharacterized protein YgbK (DUF1537 family)
MHIGMVADDLTGAADVVAPFARQGLTANVGFDLGGKPRFRMETGDALAYDTETREMPGAAVIKIANRTRAATRRLVSLAPALLYKKIDSTLRGHLRVELEAMRRELPDRLAVICPAFPANGRMVERGSLHAPGLAPEAVRVAFGMREEATAAEIFLETIRRGEDHLALQLEQGFQEGIRTVFCDAVNVTDLDTLARVLMRRPQRYLAVGSAGLATALALRCPSAVTGLRQDRLEEIFKRGCVLIIVGSRNPVSRRQAAYLSAKAGIRPLLLESGQAAPAMAAQARTLFETGQRIVLVTTPEIPVKKNPASWVFRFAFELHSQHLIQGYPHGDGAIVTGGETAWQVFQAWNAMGLSIAGEVQPGVVCGRIQSSTMASRRFGGLPFITKAGGFGTEATLARCVGLE